MEALGWIAFILGGAYLSANFVFVLALCFFSGLEGIMPAGVIALASAVAWLTFSIWISPIEISWE